jgi:hypothetical protein
VPKAQETLAAGAMIERPGLSCEHDRLVHGVDFGIVIEAAA